MVRLLFGRFLSQNEPVWAPHNCWFYERTNDLEAISALTWSVACSDVTTLCFSLRFPVFSSERRDLAAGEEMHEFINSEISNKSESTT